MDNSPTCIPALGAPTAISSCAAYNAANPLAPYPGQSGIVLEYDPPGPAGDVVLCAAPVVGSPCAAGQPGLIVDNIPLCVPPPPVPCEPPSIGLQPDCHTVSLCSPGSAGVQVDDTPVCQPLPVPCTAPSVGVEPDCHTVAACPSGVGVQVDSTPVCTPTPIVCPSPSVGIENYGGCHTVATCDPPTTVGATVDGQGACEPTPTLCNPTPGPGWTVGAAGTCIGLPWVVPGGDPECYSGAAVNLRIHWGTTPVVPHGPTTDVCL